MTRRRGNLARLLVAVMLVVPALVLVPSLSSSATVTKAQVDSAKSKLAGLQQNLSLLVEQYDTAQVQLQQTKAKLAQTRDIQAKAQTQASAAISQLTSRASSAYMDRGSQLDVLLGAGSFSDFSDRLEFLDQLQQDDSQLAATAESASQRAKWAADELAKEEAQQSALVSRIDDRKAQISKGVEQQKALVAELGKKYQEAVARRQAAQAAAAKAAAAPATGTTTGGGGVPSASGTGGSPPPSGSGAQAAVSAAYSVIGTRYVWGGASPSGFDCSGLTMWSWAHGGASLPHSSSAQYSMTARVDRGSLQPGDLVFFYSPIHHVGLYVGGGNMIDAAHSGPGGEVEVRPVNWGSYVGAGRP